MKKQLLYCLVAVLALGSCRKTNDDPSFDSTYNKTVSSKLKLGKKLENPYSVSNMRKAYQSLKTKGTAISDDPITATHYYVRFLPADSTQYDLLKNDSLLVLYPYPLDYELLGESDDNFNTETNEPGYQYAAVPIDYVFDPNVPHEILEELYIPDEEDDYYIYKEGSGNQSKKSFYRNLINESMKLTKNFADTLKTDNGIKTKFNPSGYVRVWDTRLNNLIPLVGVHVRARHWFRTKSAATDENGYYEMPNFRNPVNYAIFFETNKFDVRSGTFGQAWRNGPKQNYPWNVDIYDGVQRFYAHVFRGARRYHHGNIEGLLRPYEQAFLAAKTKYAAIDDNGDDVLGDNRSSIPGMQFGILPSIRIWRYSNNQERESDQIFSTTIHETAHTTHYHAMNGAIQFWQVSNRIAESWAVAVQWKITIMEYTERGISSYGDPFYTTNVSRPILFGYQYWTPSVNDDYTSIFIDLVDSYNQGGRYFSYSGTTGICDNVTGYSLASIEDGYLKHIYGTSSLGDELKDHKPSGVTDAQIDELLSFTSSNCSVSDPGSTGPRTLENMAGIDIAMDDHVYYWDKFGQASAGYSTTNIQAYRTPYNYNLPSGKSYADIVDMAINNSDWCYAWYKDGTVSAGYSNILGMYMAPVSYSLPPGKTVNDIVGISIAKNTNYCYAWYRDGTVSTGTVTDLDAYNYYTYTIPSAETYDNIADVGIAASTGRCYVWFKDEKMSVGYSNVLDAYIALKPMY